MKNENGRVLRLLETMVKNEFRFYRMVLRFDEFLPSIRGLYLKYSPIRDDFEFNPEINLGTRSLGQRRNAIGLCMRLVDLMPEGQRLEFWKSIEAVREFYDLGKEWTETLAALATGGFMYPPIFNLYIDKEEVVDDERTFRSLVSCKKARTVLILNPGTSMSDIKDAWPEIKAMQQFLRPGFKDFNLTKNSLKMLTKQMEVFAKRNGLKLKQSKPPSYEDIVKSRLPREAAMKAIIKNRVGKKNEGKKKKRVKRYVSKRTYPTFIQLAQEYGARGSKEAKKKANLLIQQRKRLLET